MKTIIHVIDSLGVGGAETLLVNANIHIPGFKHIVVYLRPPFAYVKQLENIPTYCLEYQGWYSMPRCAMRLRRLIQLHQAEIVHSHLYYATIVARLACFGKIILVSTYHNVLYDPEGSNYSFLYRWIDRLTYRARYRTLSVSSVVKHDLEKHIGIKHNSAVLYNYVEDVYFNLGKPDLNHDEIRIISVGNYKPQKNYYRAIQSLIPWFKNQPQITWDIYGDGPERVALEKLISENAPTNVRLMGKTNQISEVMSQYQLFFMPSRWEGFGIALVEAMAAGLPCLVSDLRVFREVATSTVLYFELNSEDSLSQQLDWVATHPEELSKLAEQAARRAHEFTKKNYCQQLQAIYETR
ncbi:MAG: glycosyltransferase family 4 protein [Cyclobacteriaceae bacterium]